jgi:hypothetical protein
MPLVDGSNVMKLPSREVAVAYLHATIDAATAGLFDAVFEEVLNTKKWPWYNPKTWEPERAKTPEEMEATTAMVQRQYQALKERYLQPAVRKGSATL